MNAAHLIKELGAEWRAPVPDKPRKFRDRRRQLSSKARLIEHFLPEYQDGGRSCLDLSCGNGVLLELLRSYGNTVLGADRAHFEFLQSQDVPYVEFDGGVLPYAFDDQSFDLVSCQGAISDYHMPWSNVLGEMFRIARCTVLLVCNQGRVLDANRALLRDWNPPGWDCVKRDVYRYKWAHRGNVRP